MCPISPQWPPTWDKVLEYLTGEGLSVDIGPLNPAGVDTMGTMLDTVSALKDTTAALHGLDETAGRNTNAPSSLSGPS